MRSLLVLAALAVAGCTAAAPTTSVGEILVPPEFPEVIRDGSQPVIDSVGLSHNIDRCLSNEEGDSRAVVTASFDSPFALERSAIVGLSSDGINEGWFWGFVEVQIPPGRSQASFDQADFTVSLNDAAPTDIVECGLHFLGFTDGKVGGVQFPVVATRTIER